MLPISIAIRISPNVARNIENSASPVYMLVCSPCPSVGKAPPEAVEELGGEVVGLDDVGPDGRRVDAVVEGHDAVPRLARLVDVLPRDGSPLEEPFLVVVAAVHVDLVASRELVARLLPAIAHPLDRQQVPRCPHDVAGEHVPEEVVGGAGVGGLGEGAAGALELGGERVDADDAGDVLEEDDDEERVLGGQHGGALGPVEELPDHDLREREHGEEVGGEEPPEVPGGDLGGVDDELAAAEYAGRRSDVSGPELEHDPRREEEVHDGAHDAGGDGQVAADPHAQVAAVRRHLGRVEEHRVDGDGDDAGDHEAAVQAHQQPVLRVEDLAGGVLQVLLEHHRHGRPRPQRPPQRPQLRRPLRDHPARQGLRLRQPPQ
ncbi:Os03g0646350 [Oryza sativa Japonica Group]|uniref:Os03g0646350 protein n=1 Tax=Oryza sativa subsp. japonica TaxID=39947 RepID=A0A0P0W0P8_ORYSJ|nr:hypothetical protein EE612_019245 [Oryza sativa]BAS85477.1 Os03g0646350 [Oryza sativa Japonica Group]